MTTEDVPLCSGKGKYYSLTDPLKHPYQPQYPTKTWAEILAVAASPPSEEKDDGWWVIPSSTIHRLARLSLTQQTEGQYWLAVGDIDEGNLPLATVVQGLHEVLDAGVEYLIYASRNSKPDDKRWRIMVPLGQPCPGEFYHHFADLFLKALAAHLGVSVDDCTNRIHQIAYLPNSGNHYEWRHQPGAKMGQTEDNTLFNQLVEASVDSTYASPQHQRNAERQRKRGHYLEAFAKRFPVDELLERYGFVSNGGKSWHHPDLQTSKSYGTDITPDEHWVTGSPSVANFIGRAGGDAFDLYAAFECGGDHKQAYKIVCKAVDENWGKAPKIQWGEHITCNGKKVNLGVVQ